MTVDKVEHLLKLADEYQTKSVFNVCVNLLKNEVAGSEEKAMSILYLANTTDMARKDEKSDRGSQRSSEIFSFVCFVVCALL